jgi:hypothetical protein
MAGTEPPAPNAKGEALAVWLKFIGLLAALSLFGWLVYRLTKAV